MSKELKALNRIKDFMSANAKHWKQDIAMIETALKEKGKQDLILNFLKEHIVFEDGVVKADFQWWYQDKETQDLLKEVLK